MMRHAEDVISWVWMAVVLTLSLSGAILAITFDSTPWISNAIRFVARAGMLLIPLMLLYAWTNTRPQDVFARALGGRWHPKPKELVWGAGTGVALGVLTFALFVYLRNSVKDYDAKVRRTYAAWGVRTVAMFWVFAILVSILHATYEEFVWRWFASRHVVHPSGVCSTEKSASWCAAMIMIITSLFFSAFHLVIVSSYVMPHVLPMAAVGAAAFLAGITWCVVTYSTGTLWSAIVSHIIVDAVLFGCQYTALFLA